MDDDREDESAHSVDRIVSALRALLGRMGVGDLSYRSVAKEAGLSTGTVAYYFESRAALLEAALDRHHDRVANIVRPLLLGEGRNAGEHARALTHYAFANQADIRLRLAAWTESWSLPRGRLTIVAALLSRVAAIPWSTGWTERDKRILVQGVVYAVQHFAALSDTELSRMVGEDDPALARAAVVEAIGRLTERLTGQGEA